MEIKWLWLLLLLASCTATKKVTTVTEKIDTSILIPGFVDTGSAELQTEFTAKVIDLEHQLKLYQQNQLTPDQLLEAFNEYCKVKPTTIYRGNDSRSVELRVENEILKYKLSRSDTTIDVQGEKTTINKLVNREFNPQKLVWSIMGLVLGLVLLMVLIMVAYVKFIAP